MNTSEFEFNPQSRCNVCNSEHLALYHKMRSSGRFTILDIHTKAIELGESLSKSSVYRHFSRHFVEKEKEPIVYDYNQDNSEIIDEEDIYSITLNFLRGRTETEIEKFGETASRFFEDFNEKQYPVYTCKIFQKILKDLLVHADLQYLLEDFQEEYSKAVYRALNK